MRERGILFKGEMVEEIRFDRKTKTRRPLKNQNVYLDKDRMPYEKVRRSAQDIQLTWVRCPYGVPGDRLWVRETFALDQDLDAISPIEVLEGSAVWYQPQKPFLEFLRPGRRKHVATGDRGRVRPGIHMPRWASRATLEVTAVRAERLQDISEEDARAEGIGQVGPDLWGVRGGDCYGSARAAFAALYCAIHGPEAWAADPLVWVISFRRIP